jgi:hypothetical protein
MKSKHFAEGMLEQFYFCRIFCWGGLNGIISRNFNLPLLNSPFNLATLLYITSGLYKRYKSVSGSDPNFGSVNLQALEQIVASFLQSSNLINQTLPLTQPDPEEVEELVWTELAGGIILGPSHLYGTNTILTGIMVYSAVCLYSPILCFQQLMGATIGTLMGRSTGLKVRYSREPRISVSNNTALYPQGLVFIREQLIPTFTMGSGHIVPC